MLKDGKLVLVQAGSLRASFDPFMKVAQNVLLCIRTGRADWLAVAPASGIVLPYQLTDNLRLWAAL
ncbi:MAG: hypothetical protein AAF702_37290 [Chloroflexota bacterium]